MYRIYYVNFDYTSQEKFSSLEEALIYAKTVGHEFTILKNGNLVDPILY